MRTKVTFITLVCALLLTHLSICQSPPGYLGKKTTIGFGFGTPSFKNTKAKTDTELMEENGKDIKAQNGRATTFGLEISHTIKRHRTLSLTYNRSRIGTEIGIPVRSVSQIVTIDGFVNAQINSVSLLYNYHVKVKGHLAPLGSSYTIGLRHNIIKPTSVISELRIPSEEQSIKDYTMIDFNKKVKVNSLVVGWSYTLLIKDILYIKPRVLVAAHFKTAKVLGNDFIFYDSESPNDAFEINLLKRLFYQEIVQFDISTGILF